MQFDDFWGILTLEDRSVTENGHIKYMRVVCRVFHTLYIPFLNYLHSKYPNWTFKAKNTNSNFADAVDAEEGINYMQTTNNN